MDDFWLKHEDMIGALHKMNLADYILGFEERRIIKYNREQEKIDEIWKDLDTFFAHFVGCFKNVFGEIQYKKVKAYIDKTQENFWRSSLNILNLFSNYVKAREADFSGHVTATIQSQLLQNTQTKT